MKNEEKTVRAYEYCVFMPTEQDDIDHVNQMFYLSHLATNKYTELRNKRRAAKKLVDRAVSEEYKALDDRVNALQAEIDDVSDEMRSTNQKNRNLAGTKDLAEVRKGLQKEVSVLRKQYKPIIKAYTPEQKAYRKELFGNVKKDFYTGTKTMYGEFCSKTSEHGINAATYRHVEQAGAKSTKDLPELFKSFKYKSWDNEGFISHQCKTTTAEILSKTKSVHIKGVADDMFARSKGQPSTPGTGYRSRNKVTLYFQVGQCDKKRTIGFPMVYHRPLPEDSTIDSATIYRDRTGRLKVVFRVKACHQTSQTMGGSIELRINPTWDTSNNSVTLCDGLTIGPDMFSRKSHEQDIQAVIDANLVSIKKELSKFNKSSAVKPDWFTERYNRVSRTNSANKFLRFCKYWERNRFDGDDVIFGADEGRKKEVKTITNYIKRTEHLTPYMRNTSTKMMNKRKEMYRVFAKELTSNYEHITLLVDKKSKKNKPNKEMKEGISESMSNLLKSVVAPYSLQTAITSSASRRGCSVEIVEVAENR